MTYGANVFENKVATNLATTKNIYNIQSNPFILFMFVNNIQ